jgi:hypothetical protein
MSTPTRTHVRVYTLDHTRTLPWLPPPPPKLNAAVAPPAAAPKLNPPAVLGDTSGVPLPAVLSEVPPKLKDGLVANALPVGVAAAPAAAAAGTAVAKLKVLGELTSAASGLPPKLKVPPAPLGDAASGAGDAAAPNEDNPPWPVASGAAEGGGDFWPPKLNTVAAVAASPPLEGEPNSSMAPGCCKRRVGGVRGSCETEGSYALIDGQGYK